MSTPNKKYWEERQEKKYLSGEKKINSYYKELEKSFEQANREIQSVINNFYWRYAEENQLSYASAQLKLSKAEIGDLQDFIDKAYENMGKYNLELNNMSIRARITRYEALQKQIDATLQQLYAIDYEHQVGNTLKDVYSDSYYRTWFNIDQYHGFHQEFAQVSAKTVEELIKYPFDGADFSTRLWKQKDYMFQQLNESITTMMIQGRNPKTLAGEFSKKFGTKEYEAYRLLHTEGSFIIEQGSQAAYTEDGVEKYQWLATLDMKTCERCAELDGKPFEVGKGIVGVSMPPLHAFDRCTTIPHYDDEDLSDDTRVARDSAGKSYTVPADMTYNQWHDKYITGKTQSEYNDIIGAMSSNGTEITNISKHAVDRAIERNVSAANTKEALLNPLKTGRIKISDNGLPSQKYIGEKATVSINPDTGVIIQVNPTSSKYANNLKKRRQ
ncbi:MAG: phage head morphosis protein family [Herbinix sp.]|jgi:SPP1 gp7 family putative phage head morphogenesis protein|nr:phage head morphosis protein family [Herbinix sp.]